MIHDEGEEASDHRPVDLHDEERIAVLDPLVVRLADCQHAHGEPPYPYAPRVTDFGRTLRDQVESAL